MTARRLAAAVIVAAVAGTAGTAHAQQAATAVPVAAVAGQPFAGTVATFEERSAAPAERFTATIHWGDGAPATSGTVTQVGRTGSYEVAGAHTFAAAGTYTFRVTITGPAGTVAASGSATVQAPTQPPPPPPATAEILGPQRLALTDPARYLAHVRPAATRHQWDLDGDGTYELDTGASPAADHGFERAGDLTVGLRATLADGRVVTATRAVTVTRPPLLGLRLGDLVVRPRSRVRLRLAIAKEAGTSFELFSWRIAGVRPRRRTLRLPGRDGPVVRLKGAQPTRRPKLVTSFPRPGNYPIVVKALDDDGHASTLHANVNVGPKGAPHKLPAGPIDCNPKDPKDESGFCPQIFVTEAAANVKTIVSFIPWKAQMCLPAGLTLQKAKQIGKLQDALDLPYPAPEQFGALQPVAAAARARLAAAEKDCLEAEPVALKWEFGDGAVLEAPPGGSLPTTAAHVYTAPGAYTARVLARMPHIVANKQADNSKNGVEKFFHVEHKLVSKTFAVDVKPSHCGPLTVRKIPVTSVPGTVGNFGIPDIGAAGCFLKTTALDGSGTLYRTFKGYDLDVNTLAVRAGIPTAGDPDDPEVVEPATGRISTADGKPLTGRFRVQQGSATGSWTVGLPLVLPAPKFDAELGGEVAALPPATGGGKFTGILVTSVHVFLAPDRGALARLFLAPPPPLDGLAPVLVGGGPKALGASHLGEPTDLEMDLDGLDLGLFELRDFTLEHRLAGGWIGGGTIAVRFLPNPRELSAPYKPLSTTNACTDTSSGIALGPDGDFLFGGAAAKFSPPLVLGGVVGVSCIAVKGQTDPFVMEGRVSAAVPPSGPFDFDGCFLMAVLKAGQTTVVLDAEGDTVPGPPGCGLKQPYTAATDLAWFHTNAKVGIYGLELADGFLDIKATSAGIAANAKGNVGRDFGVISFNASVDGGIVLPQFAFHLIGEAEVCEEVTKWIPGIGGLIAELGLDCFDGEAGIGTKGARFCAKSIGVRIAKNGSPSFGACDVDELAVTSAFADPVGLGGALTAQSAVRRVRLPRGLRAATFHVRGDGGPPVLRLRGPGGRSIDDDLEAVQQRRGHRLIHLSRGETVVEVRRPAPGLWRIEADPAGPAITGVSVSRPLAEPRVRARVRGRTLRYRARLARGDRVRFVEQGRLLTRTLGGGRSGRGRIRLRPAGLPGRRTVTAVVERSGIPYRRVRVASYRASAVARPARPRALRLRVARAARRVGWRSDLLVSWRRAARAREHEVVARLSDGRTLRLATRGRRVRVPNVDRSLSAQVRVTGIGADGRRGPGATGRARAAGPRRARVRL